MNAQELIEEILKEQNDKFKKEYQKVIKAFKDSGNLKYEHIVCNRDSYFLEGFSDYLKSQEFVVSGINPNYDNDRNIDDYSMVVKLPKQQRSNHNILTLEDH